jgi:hypothetical protein
MYDVVLIELAFVLSILVLCLGGKHGLVLGATAAVLWHSLGRYWPQRCWSSASVMQSGGKFEPWTGVWQTGDAVTLLIPANNETELSHAVRHARRPLRVVGSGHSWSPTGHTNTGTLIDLRRFDAIVGMRMIDGGKAKDGVWDQSVGQITVQAGIKVQAVTQYLLSNNKLCLYGLGSIREQTIGGVIAHGVHGPHPDGFNRHVVGLRVLLANGTYAQITREADLFMWRASIGMLGVIVEATLEVFPVPTLRFTREPIGNLDDYLGRVLPQTIFGVATFTGFLYPCPLLFSGTNSGHGYARIGRPIVVDDIKNTDHVILNNQSDLPARLMLRFNDHMHPAMQYVWPPLGTLVTCAEHAMAAWAGHSLLLSGPEQDILPNDGLIPRFYEIIDYEYTVPLPSCAAFAKELLVDERFGRVLIPICLRLMRAEPSCLSMAYEDSCVFGIEAMRGHVSFDVRAIERRVKELGGAAHLGKVMLNVGAYRHNPKCEAYRAQMDPDGVFLTPFLAVLGNNNGLTDDDQQEEFPPTAAARRLAHARARWFAALFWLAAVVVVGLKCCGGANCRKRRQMKYI